MIGADKSNSFQPDRVAFAYLGELMGSLGLYQHASFNKPRLEEGYCTDDNVRLLQYLVELSRNSDQLRQYHELVWRFILEARMPEGEFRNFRDIEGRWLDNGGSEDTYGRVARALAAIINFDPDSKKKSEAVGMLSQLLPHLKAFRAVRGAAEAIIALSELPESAQTEDVRQATKGLLEKLLVFWDQNSSADWPWFEDKMTYANALLPHAILAAYDKGLLLPERSNVLHDSAAFLINSTIKDGVFMPVGNEKWFLKGQEKSQYDQQPIEAHTMLDFLLAYHQLFPDKAGTEIVIAPYLWFFGQNSRHMAVANPETGASGDALKADGINQNRGAESLLAYLRSELLIARAPKAIRQAAMMRRQELERRTAGEVRPT